MPENPSILITGCSSGIGKYCALRLHDEGYRVFATARKPVDLEMLRNAGLTAFYLDYREPDSIHAAFDAVMAETSGTLDALYNNGAYSQPGAVEDLPIAALREQFDANFFGWHELTVRAVSVMRQQGHGRLVHCSSILGLVPAPVRGAYAASKFALEGLMITLRMELREAGIHVSLLEPGPVPSRIAENALSYAKKYIDIENSVHQELYRKRIAQLERGGTPDNGGKAMEAVYAALKNALTSRRPKPHYVITAPARLGTLGKWLLPSDLFYRLIANRT